MVFQKSENEKNGIVGKIIGVYSESYYVKFPYPFGEQHVEDEDVHLASTDDIVNSDEIVKKIIAIREERLRKEEKELEEQLQNAKKTPKRARARRKNRGVGSNGQGTIVARNCNIVGRAETQINASLYTLIQKTQINFGF